MTDISYILEFLPCRTPEEWITEAIQPSNLETLLVDHANNELKASKSAQSIIWKYAAPSTSKTSSKTSKHNHNGSKPDTLREKKTAATDLNLIFRHIDKPELLNKMSRLAREELRHFEQVLGLMVTRGVDYRHLPSSTYASKLRKGVRTYEPQRLIDTLIAGAFIEARSCERFAILAPHLDDELKKFYLSLLKSEGRHFQDYLTLATNIANEYPADRIACFAELERQAIEEPDPLFRFHSGKPPR